MRYFLEVLGILLAGAGLFMLGWLGLGRLLSPCGARTAVWAVLPASGEGDPLERDVRSLLWLRENGMARLTVVIADCGLSESGRSAAALLTRREADVLLCPVEQVGELLSAGATRAETA